MIGVRLVVDEHEAAKAVTGEGADHLDDQAGHERPRERHRSAPLLGQRAHTVRERGSEHGLPAAALEMRREAPRQLLGPEPVHEQGKVRAVLLDRAQGKKDHRARVAGEPRGVHVRALAQLDHASRGRRRFTGETIHAARSHLR